MRKTSRWLPLRQAMVVAGMNNYAIMRAAVLGRIAVLIESGETIKFDRHDCERLAAAREANAMVAMS